MKLFIPRVLFKKAFPFLLPLLFLVLGITTLKDYGVTWDGPIHYWRGQAYLRYLFTGQKNYQTLKGTRRSLYQSDQYPATYFLSENMEIGHPALNGILGALFNDVFFQKLAVFPDVESYHLFIIFVSSLLIYVVFRFGQEIAGLFAGLVASLSLILYPLFLAESHFNIKDPVETSFYSLTIYTFYQGITKRSWQYLALSSFFCGFGLSTKFNIIFLPFTLLPWLIIQGWKQIKSFHLGFSKKMVLTLFFYPLVALVILFISLPNLWHDSLNNFLSIIEYYRKIGYGIVYQPKEYLTIGNFNTYPVQWIVYTTPLVILFFSLVGIIAVPFRLGKEKGFPSLLILLWFLIPIIRTSLPQMGIFGGVRHIMEYLPAMAILAGLGAETLRRKVKSWLVKLFPKEKYFIHYPSYLIPLLFFLPISLKMIQIHPNQNVYFNPLIGGLRGAKEKNLPAWGNSFGNVYRQGINWLNENAEPGAKLVLAVSYIESAAEIWLRNDIEYSNEFRSGWEKKGEYVMEMTNDMPGWPNFCYRAYVQKFLEPIYELKVDGVPILKIWKNDTEHTKKGFLAKSKLSLLEGCIIREEKDQGNPVF